MKKQNQIKDTKEIKAESLLLQMSCDDNLFVQMEGVFFRNYSEDLMNFEKEEGYSTVTLSRDSIFHLLPERLFFKENSLINERKHFFDFNEEYKELKKKKKEILSFFYPFDTILFKLSLDLEQKLNLFAKAGNEIFIKYFLDESVVQTRQCLVSDNTSESDNYIDKLRLLLPFVSQIRGNLPLLVDLLKIIFSAYKVEIKEIAPFKKRFIIQIEGLSKEEYLAMDRALVPFFDFLHCWFLPVELICDFRIKDFQQLFKLGEPLILDYNTNL